jgi:hypothetical protein
MRKITTIRGVELLVPEKGEKHPNAGRPKGAKNVMTRVLKDAILLAAEESKHSKGGGLAGYLTYIADNKVELFVRLLMRLLPLQEKELAQAAKKQDKPRKRVVYRSVAEIRAALIARGLPVHKVDMLMDTQSPNVIHGPFKTRDVDDSSER